MRFRILAAPAAMCLLSGMAQTSETSKTVKPFGRVDNSNGGPDTRTGDRRRRCACRGRPERDHRSRENLRDPKGADVAADAGATVLDLHGYTVMP
jgi:hypothetical protein